MNSKLSSRDRRVFRVRRKLKQPVDTGRLRLSVFRSNQHIYAQIIDAAQGLTVAEANSKVLAPSGKKSDQAKEVGKALADKALKAGVSKVYFDRGSYRYHGRIKALADGAREGGLVF
jgi:large subunit ribosomal protein L18